MVNRRRWHSFPKVYLTWFQMVWASPILTTKVNFILIIGLTIPLKTDFTVVWEKFKERWIKFKKKKKLSIGNL